MLHQPETEANLIHSHPKVISFISGEFKEEQNENQSDILHRSLFHVNSNLRLTLFKPMLNKVLHPHLWKPRMLFY